MTNANADDLKVENNEQAKQFEVRLGDDVAVLVYHMAGDRIILHHTEVPKAFEGKGIGGKLARYGLTWAREHDLKAVPLCPFVASYLNRHPEFEDAVVREG